MKELPAACPLVSVVIVTWNRKGEVLQTVQSIYDQSYRNFEIIVVDNGSTDGTVEALRWAHPTVRVIALDQNIGIAEGRNRGIAVACGDIIFCLDSDASPGYDAMAKIVCKFQAEPDLGIINSKIVDARAKESDGSPGWAYSEKQRANQDSEFLSYTFSEGGCAIRKKVLEQVGLFWNVLFFGREGEDLGLRVWDAGYKIKYYPESVVYHRASAHNRVVGSKRAYFDFRNSLYVYLVRYPWWMLIVFVPLKIVTGLVKGLRRNCLRAILRALLDVIRQSPTLRKQRRPIRNDTARFYLRLLWEHGSLSWDLVSWLKYKA